MTNSTPLCVDLDGSLIRSDMLHESSIIFAKNKPWHVAAIPGWLLRGKAYLKRKIAAVADVDVQLLPYNGELLDWLKTERASGRKLVLCTASDAKYAEAVATHLDIFDDVMASDGETNLSADTKAAALVARFGAKGFDYVGNSSADLAVWAQANRSIVVGNKSLSDKAARVSTVERHISPPKPASVKTWMRALRLHQWLKNLLVFLPLLGAHRWLDSTAIVDVFLAFASFSLCASAVYLLNDLLDLESDRQHPRKKSRPFAAGTLSIPSGILASVALFTIAFCIAAILGQNFLLWLLAYATLTTTYSFLLKQFPLVDCLSLAGLYTLRIIAGGSAIDQPISFWLLAFSLFLFSSLAFIKRYAELLSVIQSGKKSAHGRGYIAGDLQLLQSIGLASGFSAILVMALYLNSSEVAELYSHPQMLWLTMPILLFWITWMWLKASRDQMHDDPVVFAIEDRASLTAGALFIGVMWLAS